MWGLSSDKDPRFKLKGKKERVGMKTPDGVEYDTIFPTYKEEMDGKKLHRRKKGLGKDVAVEHQPNDYKDVHYQDEYDPNNPDSADQSHLILTDQQIEDMSNSITNRIIKNVDKVRLREDPAVVAKKKLEFIEGQKKAAAEARKFVVAARKLGAKTKIGGGGGDSGLGDNHYDRLTREIQMEKTKELLAISLGEFKAPSDMSMLPPQIYTDMCHYLPKQFSRKIVDTMYFTEVFIRYQPKMNALSELAPAELEAMRATAAASHNNIFRGSMEKFKSDACECGLFFIDATIPSSDYMILNLKFMEPPPPIDDEDDIEDVEMIHKRHADDVYGVLTDDELTSCIEDRLVVHVLLQRAVALKKNIDNDYLKRELPKVQLLFKTAFFSLCT